MEIINKKIDELIPYENNPRKNDDAVEYVAQSIKEFGFKVPLVIDENNIIVTGHTRLKAAKELGLVEVPCIIANDLTPEQIKAFRIADNKVSDYSIWDNKKLLEELDEIGSNIFTGFEESDLFEDIKVIEDVSELDESDKSVLEENEDGVTYVIQFKTQNKDFIEKIKNFIENNGKEESNYGKE